MSNLLSTSPDTELQVTIKNVYGHERVYPVCERAKLLCQLSGGQTFTDQAIALCKKLGYSFVITSTQPKSL